MVPAPPLSEQVETILAAFSLTITQAARVLDVSRPTVYAWRKSSDLCSADELKHQRLLKIYTLAREWQGYDKGPLGDRNLVPFGDDRRCLIDYLAAAELDETKIRERMELIARHPEDPRVAGHHALNWREGFRRLGFEEGSQEERDGNFEDNLRRIRYEY